jgi:hypothetical protein
MQPPYNPSFGTLLLEDVDFEPTQIENLTLWLDAADASTVTSVAGAISQWSDKSGNGNHATQATGSVQPSYEGSNTIANGNPAIVWPDTANQTFLFLPGAVSFRTLYIVMAYKDGIDATFDGYDGIICKDSVGAGTRRIMGSLGSADLIGSDAMASVVSKNGATSSQTILPLSLSILKFSPSTLQTNASGWQLGRETSGSNRGWKGPICSVIAFDRTVSASEDESILTYLANRYGISL